MSGNHCGAHDRAGYRARPEWASLRFSFAIPAVSRTVVEGGWLSFLSQPGGRPRRLGVAAETRSRAEMASSIRRFSSQSSDNIFSKFMAGMTVFKCVLKIE